MKLSTKVTTKIRNYYMLKLDETDKVEQSGLTMYQELIGEIRW